MAEFTSKVTTARPKSASLRATVPEAVVKLLELEPGDEIVWTVKAAGGQVLVSIAKAR